MGPSQGASSTLLSASFSRAVAGVSQHYCVSFDWRSGSRVQRAACSVQLRIVDVPFGFNCSGVCPCMMYTCNFRVYKLFTIGVFHQV